MKKVVCFLTATLITLTILAPVARAMTTENPMITLFNRSQLPILIIWQCASGTNKEILEMEETVRPGTAVSHIPLKFGLKIVGHSKEFSIIATSPHEVTLFKTEGQAIPVYPGGVPDPKIKVVHWEFFSSPIKTIAFGNIVATVKPNGEVNILNTP